MIFLAIRILHNRWHHHCWYQLPKHYIVYNPHLLNSILFIIRFHQWQASLIQCETNLPIRKKIITENSEIITALNWLVKGTIPPPPLLGSYSTIVMQMVIRCKAKFLKRSLLFIMSNRIFERKVTYVTNVTYTDDSVL